MHPLLLAATATALTLQWDPPQVYDIPHHQWPDPCVVPTNAVPLNTTPVVQYRIDCTNSVGDVLAFITEASNTTLRVELPTYAVPCTNTLTVTALYAEEPLESEPSCALIYITPGVRPPPTGLRVLSATLLPESGAPTAILTLRWEDR